jgi:FAD/FMN-containing dehydrogenase
MVRMNRILELDVRNRRARVQPGLINLDLSRAIATHGIFYAPDPSSQKVSTIGGNVGTNAGGPHCLSYGTTTNHVLGVEYVDGEGVIHHTSLDDSGYDLTGLLVGSEGTLGLVTAVDVRLMALPESVRVGLAAFPDVESASEAVSAIIAAGIVPTALEIMDKLITSAVEAHYHAGFPLDAGAVLLVEIAGPRDDMLAGEAAIARIAQQHDLLAFGGRRRRARSAVGIAQGRGRRARTDRAELLHPRCLRAAHEIAGGDPRDRPDRKRSRADGRQRLSRRRRKPAPAVVLRSPRCARGTRSRGSGNGNSRDVHRDGRHDQRRTRHRLRET